MTGDGWDDRTGEALRALRHRRVNLADDLVEQHPAEAILAACRRFDRTNGATPGLLVHWIRADKVQEGDEPTKQSQRQALQERFRELAAGFAEGDITESHARMQQRCWPDDPDRCDGNMVIIGCSYPTIEVECDRCAFVASYPLRALAGLRKPDDGQDRIGLATPGVGKPLLSRAAGRRDMDAAF